MLKYILTLLLITSLSAASKSIVFFECKNQAGYVETIKNLMYLSDEFIFAKNKKDARFIVDVEFQRLFIENSIYDTQTGEYKYLKTELFSSGEIEETYNKNTLNVLDEIKEEHDLNWIIGHFYEIKNGSMIVANGFLNNGIRKKELGEPILELESFEGGEILFIVTGNSNKTTLSKIDTVTGNFLPVVSEDKAFLSIVDYDKNREVILYKKIKEGKTVFFELSLGGNTVQPIDLVDEEVVKARYYGDRILVLSGGDNPNRVSNTLKIDSLSKGTAMKRKKLIQNSNIVDFEIAGESILLKTNDRRILLYNIQTEERTETGIEGVSRFSTVSPEILLVETETGGKWLVKHSNLKRILIKEGGE